MKISQLVTEHVKAKKLDWIEDPVIGWFMESDPVRVYYGANESDVADILENGIYADENGYVKCALEPYTAHHHAMPLTETYDKDNRVVFVIDIPTNHTTHNPLYIKDQAATNKDLYESWGKSDVEFYALVDVESPKHIPVSYIKGYMIKNDS